MSDAHLDHAKKAWPGEWANHRTGQPAAGETLPVAASTARAVLTLPASPHGTRGAGDIPASPWCRHRGEAPVTLGDDPKRWPAADPCADLLTAA